MVTMEPYMTANHRTNGPPDTACIIHNGGGELLCEYVTWWCCHFLRLHTISNKWMNKWMNVQHGGMILTKETEVFREKRISVLLSPLQIPHRLAKGWELDCSDELSEPQYSTEWTAHTAKHHSWWTCYFLWLVNPVSDSLFKAGCKCRLSISSVTIRYHALPNHHTGTPRTGTGPENLDVSLASATSITVLFSRYFCPSICHELILESGNIVSLILQSQHYMAVSDQLHALAA